MANKNCSKCSSINIKKDWFKRWKQRYKCKNCWYVFQNQSRDYNTNKIWKDYSFWKQTYEQLSDKYWITKQWVQKKLDKIHIKKRYKTTRNSNYNRYYIFLKKLLNYGV